MWIRDAWNFCCSVSRPFSLGRRHNSRATAFERLESRLLLAGNVLVSLTESRLEITGDDQSNDLELVASPGALSLKGRLGTTINGTDAPFVVSASSTTLDRDLIVRLLGGSDVFSVGTDVTIRGPVSVSLGAGDDQFNLTGANLVERLRVDTGAGVDSVSLNRLVAEEDVIVNSSDSLLMAISESTLRQSLAVSSGAAADTIVLNTTAVTGGVSLRTGRGDDNVLLKSSTLRSSLYVDAGAGRDVAWLDGTTVGGRTSLWMRQGDDSVRIQGSTVLSRSLVVGALLGADQLEIATTADVGSMRKYGKPGSTIDTTQKERIEGTPEGALARATSLVNAATPRLTVDITPPEAAENSTTSPFTVSRSGSTVQAVTVQLSGSVAGRVTVPAQIVIPAGSSTVSGVLQLLDNDVADGAGQVQINATGAGYLSGNDTFSITDNEVAGLNLTSTSATVPETASAGQQVTVSRNTVDLTQTLTVALSSSDSRLSVPASVSIPAGATSVTFVATPVSDPLVNAATPIVITATATGLVSDTLELTVTDTTVPALTLVPASSTVSENAASGITATVSRNTADRSQPLTVLLVSNSERVTVPSSIVIPAGQGSVELTISPVDNLALDGPVTAQLTASAAGFTAGLAALTVTDNETGVLSLGSVGTSLNENSAGGSVITITRDEASLAEALTVVLNADSGALTVPAAVTIPAGANSATFTVIPLDDTLVSGSRVVTISAAASGYASGTLLMTVVEDETSALQLSPATRSLIEGAGGTAVFTVSRNTADVSASLVVSVATTSARINVPPTVTIPAGQSQVDFSVTAVDDAVAGLLGSVTFQVSADGFSGAGATVNLTDNDLLALSIDPTSSTVSESIGQLPAVLDLGRIADSDVVVSFSYSAPDLLTGPATVTVPAGQQTVNVSLTVIAGSVSSGQRTGSVTVTLGSSGTTDTAAIIVQDADSFALTTDVSENLVVNSSETLITRSSDFRISGVTAAQAIVAVDSDGDGLFDDASGAADSAGAYSVTVPLAAGGPDRGDHRLIIRATTPTGVADTVLNVHYATGTVIRFQTSAGTFDAELLDSEAPVTVANFRSYQSSPVYDNLIVHRSVADFVIQGGGFTLSDEQISPVQTSPPIANEFLAANSNVRGTLAMAMVAGNINSGSSQWFINVKDNTFLDAGKYTVFGRVLGAGMVVVDSINNLNTYDMSGIYGISALNEVPLTKSPPPGTQLTGTVTVQVGSSTMTGAGTAFLTQLTPGAAIWINGEVYRVQSIASNTSAVLADVVVATETNSSAWKDFLPSDADFVVFGSIEELLPLLP